MCPHEPKGECGHINHIMTGPVTINHVHAINCQIFNFVVL